MMSLAHLPHQGLQFIEPLGQQEFVLHGKIAVVTGGAGLYGDAASKALCVIGATVLVASRSDQTFQKKCAGLREH